MNNATQCVRRWRKEFAIKADLLQYVLLMDLVRFEIWKVVLTAFFHTREHSCKAARKIKSYVFIMKTIVNNCINLYVVHYTSAP